MFVLGANCTQPFPGRRRVLLGSSWRWPDSPRASSIACQSGCRKAQEESSLVSCSRGSAAPIAKLSQLSGGYFSPVFYKSPVVSYKRTTVLPLRRRIKCRISSTLMVESTCGTGSPLRTTIASMAVASLSMAESTCCSNSLSVNSAG
jgi:hypothetical protein